MCNWHFYNRADIFSLSGYTVREVLQKFEINRRVCSRRKKKCGNFFLQFARQRHRSGNGTRRICWNGYSMDGIFHSIQLFVCYLFFEARSFRQVHRTCGAANSQPTSQYQRRITAFVDGIHNMCATRTPRYIYNTYTIYMSA